MKDRAWIKYFIITAIPIIILISMTITPLKAMLYGQEILLQTNPVDPTDAFRGDYVALSYKIDNVAIEKFPQEIQNTKSMQQGPEGYPESVYYDFSSIKNKQMYAVLKPAGQFYEVDKITFERPRNGIYLKCNLDSNYYSPYGLESNKTIPVNYGLDKFFVPEKTGTQLQEASRQGQLVAKVKVYQGYALLENILEGSQIISK